MAIYNLNKLKPRLPNGDYWIAENAQVIGDVRLGVDTGIWFGAVLRGDNEPIIIGNKTNIQENSVIHVDEGVKVVIGSGCTIGHKTIIHGCTIGSNSLIGMGAIILNNVIIIHKLVNIYIAKFLHSIYYQNKSCTQFCLFYMFINIYF